MLQHELLCLKFKGVASRKLHRYFASVPAGQDFKPSTV